MKLLVAALAVLALAVPAFAGGFINDGAIIARDGNGHLLTNTFFQSVGDCEVDVVYGTDIAHTVLYGVLAVLHRHPPWA